MSDDLDLHPLASEDRRDVHDETAVPPLGEYQWEPNERLTRLIKGGVTLTLRATPYLITIWLFGGDELRYEIRKHARWIPWAIRYAGWWLNQRSY